MRQNRAYIFLAFSIFMVASSTFVSADALKNSLSSMLSTKDSATMVNLSSVNLNGKPQLNQNRVKTRAKTAVVALVNGYEIIKSDADSHLSTRTQGKIVDMDYLPRKQQKKLIEEMSLAILSYLASKEELSEDEKVQVLGKAWMQKSAMKIVITDEEALETYNNIKKSAADNNSTSPVPEFDKVKNRIKSQILEKRIIGKLIKDVDIKVLD